MIRKTVRAGYVLLLTVLAVGIVSSTSAIAILLLGLSIERNAYAVQLSAQAFAGAWSCAERTILALQQDLDYAGDEDLTITYGYGYNHNSIGYAQTTCQVYPVGGEGNEDRTICTEAKFGSFTIRRLEVVLSTVLPVTTVDSWEEVSEITLCSAFTGANTSSSSSSSSSLGVSSSSI